MGASLWGQLVTQGTNARNEFVGGRREREQQDIAQALQQAQLQRQAQQDAVKEALTKAQTQRALRPGPIDPNSPDVLGAKSKQQEAIERLRASLRPAPVERVVPVGADRTYTKLSEAIGKQAPPPASPTEHFSTVTIQPEGEKPIVQTYNTRTGQAGPVIGSAKETGGAGAAALRTKVGSNRSALQAIDDAIKDVESNPNAFGLKRGIPLIGDAVNQRVDPGGVGVRAKVANIGSQKMHDRSGAAVTAKEFPRLAPFIPQIGDTPQAIASKLREMRKIVEQETSELEKVGNIPAGGQGGGRAGGSGEAEWAKLNPPKAGESYEAYHQRYLQSRGGGDD